MITKASLENSLSMGRTARQDGAKLARPEFLNEQGLIFGASYDSRAVVPDGSPPPAIDDPVTQYVPSARPGARAPHVWLERMSEPSRRLTCSAPASCCWPDRKAALGRMPHRGWPRRTGPSWSRIGSAEAGNSPIPTGDGRRFTVSGPAAPFSSGPMAMSAGAAARERTIHAARSMTPWTASWGVLEAARAPRSEGMESSAFEWR